MSDKEDSNNDGSDNDEHFDNDNAYVNQITLNYLISKTQLHKLNKLKQKDDILEPTYDKDRIHNLFNQLLNNDKPDDLLEDVKECFDAFIEKSIYYLEIHDKNEIIQKERNDQCVEEIQINDDINYDDECNKDEDEEDEEDQKPLEEYFEEPVKKIYSKYPKKSVSNGVEDIHKLPLDWFNTTRQNYKKNQIIPRKKEIIIENSTTKKIVL